MFIVHIFDSIDGRWDPGIKQSQHGYLLTDSPPSILAPHNGKRLTDKPEHLSDGDIIEFSELKARFFIEPGGQ